GPASCRQTSPWWSARIVTPRCAARRSAGQVFDEFATENDTSAGSRLTEVNELAARPTSSPSTSAATATTPLGKTPNASRRRPRGRRAGPPRGAAGGGGRGGGGGGWGSCGAPGLAVGEGGGGGGGEAEPVLVRRGVVVRRVHDVQPLGGPQPADLGEHRPER